MIIKLFEINLCNIIATSVSKFTETDVQYGFSILDELNMPGLNMICHC